MVKNLSKYVVCLVQNVVLQFLGISGLFVKIYILFGEIMMVFMGEFVSGNMKVKFFLVSCYGVEVFSFILDFNKK